MENIGLKYLIESEIPTGNFEEISKNIQCYNIPQCFSFLMFCSFSQSTNSSFVIWDMLYLEIAFVSAHKDHL